MLAQNYAHALYESKVASTESLVRVLKTKGHLALLPAILAEYEKLLESKKRTRGAVLRVAKAADATRYEHGVAQRMKELGHTIEKLEVVEDTSLVGGFVLEGDTYEVDSSFKGRLIELYQRMVGVGV